MSVFTHPELGDDLEFVIRNTYYGIDPVTARGRFTVGLVLLAGELRVEDLTTEPELGAVG